MSSPAAAPQVTAAERSTGGRVGSCGGMRAALENLLLAAAYVAFARIGQALAIPPGNVTAVWIPSGLILAAVLVRGTWLWPGIFAGAFVGNVWAYIDTPELPLLGALAAATANGAGDALGIVIGARLLRRVAPGSPFERPSHVGAFLAFGVLFSAAVSALFGVSSLCATGIVPWSGFAYTATTWLLGDGVGVLILTPWLLCWTGRKGRLERTLEVAVFAVLLLGVTVTCLQLWPSGLDLNPPFFVVTPLLMWAVLRLDRRVTFTAVAVVAGMSVVATANGHGPFVAPELNTSLLNLQSFVAVVVITVLFFYATTAERSAGRAALRELNRDLERRVAERTAQLADELEARAALEAERNQLAARIQHRQKLESLGVLAGGIAHDFNNLLVGVLGNADLARQGLPAGSPARVAIDDVVCAAQQAASLANQMLAYSGRGVAAVEPVDLNAIVTDLERLLRASVGGRVRLELQLSAQVPTFVGAVTQIRQLLMNLVINAAEAYGPDGGVVVVRTSHAEFGGEALAAGHGSEAPRPGHHVVIEVQDRGSGMDAETQARMFEPFFSTKFTGRGLGMATTVGVVRAHNGVILVDSAPGRGTTMTVLLPVVETGSVPAADEQVRDDASSGALRVLAVDDEETVLRVAARLLTAAGHDVLMASGGREAVDIVRRAPDSVDCVLLDMTMPGMDGLATLRALRDIRADMPIVLTSGFSEADAGAISATGDFLGFLQKPYLASDLRRAIAAAMRRSAGDA